MLRLLTILSLLFGGLMQAQEFNVELMDSFLMHINSNDRGMGSLAVMKGNKLVYADAVGFANREDKISATKDTRYKIGSISKTYTATMIMASVEEGLLSLSDKLSAYYPNIKNSEHITVAHLLSHRTGIPGYLSSNNIYMQADQKNLLKQFEDFESDFEPDHKHEYSNSNYYLLGLILEQVTGESYQENLTLLMNKCALSNTECGRNEKHDRDAFSYAKTLGWQRSPAWHMSWAFGAGDIISTASETCAFMYKLNTGAVISTSSVELMQTINEGYGLGMFAVPYDTAKGYGHNGRIENFDSGSYHFPDLDLTITYLSNAIDMSYNDVLLGVLAISTGRPYDFPDLTIKEEISLTEAQLQPLVGTYTSPSFPMDIKVFLSDGKLMAQATGQGAFPLTAIGETEFIFKPAGINITFALDKESLTLTQGGMTNRLTKKE